MKRSQLLLHLKSFFEKEEISSCYELYLEKENSSEPQAIGKERSIFIVGADISIENQLFNALSSMKNLTKSKNFRFYDSLDSLLKSDLLPKDNALLEYNWRGRVLKYNMDFNISNLQEKFVDFFLKSYFRLIINKQNENYFSYYDIFPKLYSFPHVDPGRTDCKKAIANFFSFLKKEQMLDKNYDFVKMYFSNSLNSKKEYKDISFFSEKEVTAENLLNEVSNRGCEKAIDDIHEKIKQLS